MDIASGSRTSVGRYTLVMRRWYPLIRRVIPRRLRQFVGSPVAETRPLLWKLQYQLAGPSALEVRPGWTVRFHPETGDAFRAHHSNPIFREELDEFVNSCTPGMTLIDVGAHYGVFTLAALHYGGPDAHVIAVDPSPEAQALLAINLELNAVSSRATRLECALAASSQSIRVLTAGGGRQHQMVRAPHDRSDAIVLATRTLDDVARESGRRITHLKIDVEGFEQQVLEGASTVLSEHRPFLTLELHPALLAHLGDSGQRVLDLVHCFGYSGTCLDSNGRQIPMAAAASGYVNRLALRPGS